jgi:hypothetical protein
MASSGDTSRAPSSAPSDHAPRSAPADVSARTPGIARRVPGLPRPTLFGRRIRARFVLASCVAVVLAGMLGATMFKWTVVFPGSHMRTGTPFMPGLIDSSWESHLRVGGMVCNKWSLGLTWMDYRFSAVDGTAGDPFPFVAERDLIEADVRAHAASARWCSMYRIKSGVTLESGCRLWLARTVLGAGCGLFGWLAWWMRPRWRVGHCQSCGYDLAGLAGKGMCPECGPQPASGIAS